MRRSSVLAASAAMAVLMAVLASCQKPAADTTDRPDTTAIADQLRQAEAKWNRAYAEHDSATLAGAYADDAALANPGAALVAGRAAIARETAAFAADPALKVKFASDRIQVAASGDLAYSRGHYDMTMTDPATKKPATGSGSYLTVWKKQSDGQWKAVEDFVVPGPAATP